VDVVAEVELGPRAAPFAVAVRRPADPDDRRVGVGDVGREQQGAGHVGQRAEEPDEQRSGVGATGLVDDQPRPGAVDGRVRVRQAVLGAVRHGYGTRQAQQIEKVLELLPRVQHRRRRPLVAEVRGDDPADVERGRQQRVHDGELVVGLVLDVGVDDDAAGARVVDDHVFSSS
jgi:hypothetical protein